MAQMLSRWPAEAQVSPCAICGEQIGTGTGFLSQYFGFFPLVSIVPQLLHSHSFIYQRCCIILANGVTFIYHTKKN